MGEALCTLQDVSKVYTQGPVRVRALDGVTLTVAAGRSIAIVGPSGSGKSTLLHLMGGLTRPTSGSVEWLGRRLNRLHDEELSRLRNQHVGFIFQRLNLIPYLTAEQNVALPLKYRGVPTRQRLEIARECLRQVGLARRTRHFPSELSGGEEQRVAVARALAAAPRLLLADEPTGNVDTSAAETMVELFLGLLEGSAGIVVVTHNLRVAERMQEVIELIDGRLSP